MAPRAGGPWLVSHLCGTLLHCKSGEAPLAQHNLTKFRLVGAHDQIEWEMVGHFLPQHCLTPPETSQHLLAPLSTS